MHNEPGSLSLAASVKRAFGSDMHPLHPDTWSGSRFRTPEVGCAALQGRTGASKWLRSNPAATEPVKAEISNVVNLD